jgi:release factor glutamine methyltransferase
LTRSAREALNEGAARLRAAGIPSARLDARVLLAMAMEVSTGEVFTETELEPATHERFAALIARRAAREPLAYLTGTKEFWSLAIAVGPGVLIPRPETETLIETALNEFPPEGLLRVLDIGTGSGCLLIAFLSARTNATGVGVDASDAALAWARRNVLAHGLGSRCRLEIARWEPAETGLFDVILVNPPYLTTTEFEQSQPEIRDWEPRSALVAGEDGLEAFRALGPVFRRRLATGGKAFIEVGAGQATAAGEILLRSGLDVKAAISDLSGVPRCLIAGQAGSRGR